MKINKTHHYQVGSVPKVKSDRVLNRDEALNLAMRLRENDPMSREAEAIQRAMILGQCGIVALESGLKINVTADRLLGGGRGEKDRVLGAMEQCRGLLVNDDGILDELVAFLAGLPDDKFTLGEGYIIDVTAHPMGPIGGDLEWYTDENPESWASFKEGLRDELEGQEVHFKLEDGYRFKVGVLKGKRKF